MFPHALPVLLLAILAPGQPGPRGDKQPAVIEGEVRFAGTGTPVPGATLYFYDKDEADWRVRADGEGRFRWTMPRSEAIQPRNVGEPGPFCGVIIQDEARWSWEVVNSSGRERVSPQGRQEVFRSLRKEAASRWRAADGGPRLIVECPAAGEIEVAVRGPDGAAVVDRPVRVSPVETPRGFFRSTSVEFRGKTDAAGAIRIRWFEGLRQLRVWVPELGFGTTGAFEVLARRAARVELPPLARFARVEGTVDPGLFEPGLIVDRLPDPMAAHPWESGRAPVDDQGRFVLRDVLPGSFTLELRGPVRDGISPTKNARAVVRADPGETIRGLTIRPASPPRRPPAGAAGRPQAPVPAGGPGARAEEEVVWVRGTVRDRGGRGVAGASVLVRTSYHGGVRMYEQVEEATTDPQGQYQIRGPLHETMTTLIVVAHTRGRLPVVAYAAAPSAAKPERPPLDLTLPDEEVGNALHVLILKDGKPHRGANVRLISEGVIELGMWAAEAGKSSPAWTAIINTFYPRTTTGADGTAHFTNLFPGVYQVLATDREPGAAPGRGRPRGDLVPEVAIARDIGVAAGQELDLTLAFHPLSLTVPLRVLRPDGSPVADQHVSFAVGLRSTHGTTSLQLDARGAGSYTFDSTGLWAVDLRFRDSKATSFPVTEEPFDQVEALLPVSPGLALPDPLVLKGIHRERGSLRVEVRDIDGRPARGAVMIVTSFGFDRHADQAASSDAQGVVRFADLPHGRYRLHGSIDGQAPPFRPEPGRLPDDPAMRDQMAFQDQWVEVQTGLETRAVLQPKRVGYVRGTLHPPADLGLADYGFAPIHKPGAEIDTQQTLDEKTGEFVAGPFFPDTITLRMVRLLEGGQVQAAGDQVVEVPAGSVAHVEFRPREATKPATAPDGTAQAFLGMGGLSFLNEVPRGAGGTVRLADGETPAFGARGIVLVPGQPQPVASAVSDAAGNLSWRGRWVTSQAKTSDGKPAPKPKAVVWLPGRTGAAVVEVEPDRPVRAILPAPLEARGAVTLGGRPSAGVNARLRIVADRQGTDDLDAALRQATSADAEGQFILRGLTPGRYLVQATRDDIWLSESVPLAVGPDQPPAKLTLDIPEPGSPVVLELVDGKGQPVARRALTLARPEGPLATLWPTAFHTDPEGRLTLRGLETGSHSIRIEGEADPRRFDVPRARDKAQEPEVVRFVSDPAR